MKRSGETSRRRPTELVLALYIHMMGLLILSLYENRKRAHARYQGTNFRESSRRSATMSRTSRLVTRSMAWSHWFADGATAEFCITLPQNIGPVRAMELK